jgi:hypothetical protein
MLDSPEGVCAGQPGSEYPATSVPFSKQLSALPDRGPPRLPMPISPVASADPQKRCSGGIRWAREDLNLRPLPCQITRARYRHARRTVRDPGRIDGKPQMRGGVGVPTVRRSATIPQRLCWSPWQSVAARLLPVADNRSSYDTKGEKLNAGLASGRLPRSGAGRISSYFRTL